MRWPCNFERLCSQFSGLKCCCHRSAVGNRNDSVAHLGSPLPLDNPIIDKIRHKIEGEFQPRPSYLALDHVWGLIIFNSFQFIWIHMAWGQTWDFGVYFVRFNLKRTPRIIDQRWSKGNEMAWYGEEGALERTLDSRSVVSRIMNPLCAVSSTFTSQISTSPKNSQHLTTNLNNSTTLYHSTSLLLWRTTQSWPGALHIEGAAFALPTLLSLL